MQTYSIPKICSYIWCGRPSERVHFVAKIWSTKPCFGILEIVLKKVGIFSNFPVDLNRG